MRWLRSRRREATENVTKRAPAVYSGRSLLPPTAPARALEPQPTVMPQPPAPLPSSAQTLVPQPIAPPALLPSPGDDDDGEDDDGDDYSEMQNVSIHVRAGCAEAHRGRFLGKPLRAISRFRHQNAQTPPSPLVGEGGWGDEGQRRIGMQNIAHLSQKLYT